MNRRCHASQLTSNEVDVSSGLDEYSAAHARAILQKLANLSCYAELRILLVNFNTLPATETEHTATVSPFLAGESLGRSESLFSIHRWPTVLSVTLVGIGGLLMSCGGDSGNTAKKTSAENSAVRDDVTLVDFSISEAPKSAKAGEIRFYAKNTGKSLHELVVVKSDANPGDLPVYGAQDTPAEGHVVGDVDEDKITSEGEVEDIEPGATKDATFVLAPGKYLLICNLPTHYGLGMRVALTVS